MEEEKKQRGQRKRYVKLFNKAVLIDDLKLKYQLKAELSFWTAQSSLLDFPSSHPISPLNFLVSIPEHAQH